MKEMVGGCCVCSDERGWPENPLVYCDGANCNVAVHQACYGIVTVPTGPWYCRKCESQERSARVRCELCPSRTGALKKTNTSGWAHVVCALYIPEVRFGNVTTMEPINLDSIPVERYGKTCYICQELSKGSKATMGACMQCNKTGCRQQFHVTCAQQLGLLCEEAGNYLDNVKYCGYCQHHYSKLKKGGNVKLIPPYKPITYETGSSDGPSSPEKESEGGTAAGGQQMSAPGVNSEGAATSGTSSTQPSVANIGGSVVNLIAIGSVKGLGTTASSLAGVSGGVSGLVGSSSTNSQLNMQGSSSTVTGMSTSGAGGPQVAATSSSTASSSSSSAKNRKSSSNSKSASGSSASGSGGNVGSSSSTTAQQGSSSGSTNQSSTNGSAATGTTSGGANGSSSKSTSSGATGSSSSKDYKEGKHSGKGSSGSSGSGKTTSTKDRDTYKDKSTKSTSSSSSSSNSTSSSSKNKEGGSSSTAAGHHSAHESQSKADHSGSSSRSEKSSGGGGGGNKLVPNSSILAPSVLQQATTAAAAAKDGVNNKFPYATDPLSSSSSSTVSGGVDLSSSGGGGGAGVGGPTDAGGAFGNEVKSTIGASSIQQATAGAPVATKKRKASDSTKLHTSGLDEKTVIKDVSVTLIPLRQSSTLLHHEKMEIGDSKKVKSERGSPLHSQLNESVGHPHGVSSAASNSVSSSASGVGVGGSTVNLLATQTGATSISITKHLGSQLTTTNVIIKPPVINLPPTTTSSVVVGGGVGGTGGASSGVAGGNGTTSLVVSVPLSPAGPGGASLNLPGANSSSSASQNLFQQAIQNRTEHLNFPNASRTSSQTNQAPLSRSSPIIATNPGGGGAVAHHDGHGSMLMHRQSPLIQASNLSIVDNGSGRSSLSPSMSGTMMHQSDSGMLKVTYEKQPPHGGGGNMAMNAGNAGRLAALQDDAMTTGRRSSTTLDGGMFQSKGLFSGTIANSVTSSSASSAATSLLKRGRDYGAVTSSSNVVRIGEKETLSNRNSNNPSPSNLFATSSSAVAPFKSSVPTTPSFSSFVASSRTPDFNAFGGVGGGGSSGSGRGGDGGLKICYEPQTSLSVSTPSNTTLLTPSPSPSMSHMSGPTSIASNAIGAQPMVKDSPPSSPNSEAGSSARKRTRKQESSARDSSTGAGSGGLSHGKVFQNGVHASHMLGNQLNPNSSVAQKMSDQLHMELEAHSVYTNDAVAGVSLMGPMFPGKHASTSSSTSSSSSSGGTGGKTNVQGPPSLSSMLSGGNTASGGAPQSLEQLLERQWEQGSQFLMEQAQHFDIASLLSCLHQLRAENVRLEDHVNNLVARRDHLLAVNARLAIPLNQSTGGSSSFNATTNGPTDVPPSNVIQRGNEPMGGVGGGSSRSSGGGVRNHPSYAMENGIDFRSASQQQQAIMMHAVGHQGGPGNTGGGGSGNSGGVVRTATTMPVAGTSGSNSSGVLPTGAVAATTTNNGGGVGGAMSAVRIAANSSSTGAQLNSNSSGSCSSSGAGGGTGGLAIMGHVSNGSMGPSSAASLMSGGSGMVVGSSSTNSGGVVTAMGIIAGGSRSSMANAPPMGMSYPTTFQHFRRDDAQMKPSS